MMFNEKNKIKKSDKGNLYSQYALKYLIKLCE